MRRHLIAVALVAAACVASEAAAQSCTTPQPAPAFVCVKGGWLPPGHPDIPKPTTYDPQPDPTAPQFTVGHTYRRDATGTRLHAVAVGQAVTGTLVFAMECLDANPEDLCDFVGQGRFVLAHASRSGWTDLGAR